MPMENRKVPFLRMAFEYVSKMEIPGDYFEFGVFRGKSFISAMQQYELIKNTFASRNENRVFHAFDSFQGLPEPLTSELDKFKAKDFYATQAEFERNILKSEFNLNNVKIYPGFFNDTLNSGLFDQLKENDTKIAILYVDTDIYSSSKTVLNFCKSFLQPGSLICLDDFFTLKANQNNGQIRAMREFILESPELTFMEWGPINIFSKSFIVGLSGYHGAWQ